MRYTIKYTLAATLVAGVAAHQHGHQHFHVRKEASPVEQRDEPDAVTKYVPAAVETVYELNGEILKADEAKEGLDLGDYVVVGETAPTVAPPPPPPAPKPTTSSVADLKMGAKFIEKSTSSPPPPAPTTTSSPPPEPKPTAPAEDNDNTGGEGVDTPFPSGKVKCSEFPSKYGAVALDWLDLGGWAGLQFVPDFTKSSLSISSIITGIAGETCTEGCMCSYACPPGYQKTQWPKAQGSTKQSVGGLYCNNDGYLELTRPEFDTICEAGVGGVSIQNDLDEVVSTCRTDYPGTESMVVPAIANPGSTVELTNPDQDKYYVWDGMSTSAQYYVNPKGYAAKDACLWNSPLEHDKAGNWAPIIAGVGRSKDGITYLSIFQNLPTSNAKLDFNIEIKGDVTSECSYIDGKWSGGGSDGCTTGMKSGGKAVFRYF